MSLATRATGAHASANSAGNSAADTVRRLGAFPVASDSPGRADAPQVASVHHIGLVAMGSTVEAELPDGTDARITALGPDFPGLPGRVVPKWKAITTVRVTAVRRTLTVRASQFFALNEDHRLVPLTASRPSLTLAPGQTGTLTLSGVFTSGSASVAWEPTGRPMAVWDFAAEFD